MKTQCQYLIQIQRNELLKKLQIFEEPCSTWKIGPVGFELKYDMTMICSIPYPIPKVHEEIFKNKLDV